MHLVSDDKVLNFLHDPRFFNWVVKPDEVLAEYWKGYAAQNPGDQKYIAEARLLIKGMMAKEKELGRPEIELLWKRIQQSIILSRKRTIRLYRWAAAAVVFLMLGIGSVAIWLNTRNAGVDYASVPNVQPTDNNITLFLADQKAQAFSNQDVLLEYNQQGSITTDAGLVMDQSAHRGDGTGEQLNQLVVPRGKRSNILLSDGTRLWLNSGSRAIYPVVFNKKTREIFIEGEAYLEVAPDASKPFVVKTDKLDVSVLGTKFNVSAYPDENLVQVVLVEGSIKTGFAKESVTLKPEQAFTLDKKKGATNLERVNVMEFTSWKEGWLLCNRERMTSVAAKLSRYYDVDIEIIDSRVNNLTLSGKLDLKSSCNEVLEIISSTAPVKYEVVDGTIRLSKR